MFLGLGEAEGVRMFLSMQSALNVRLLQAFLGLMAEIAVGLSKHTAAGAHAEDLMQLFNADNFVVDLDRQALGTFEGAFAMQSLHGSCNLGHRIPLSWFKGPKPTPHLHESIEAILELPSPLL